MLKKYIQLSNKLRIKVIRLWKQLIDILSVVENGTPIKSILILGTLLYYVRIATDKIWFKFKFKIIYSK